jgi:hypothetical protein
MGYELNFIMLGGNMERCLVFGYGKQMDQFYKGLKFGVEMRVWW